MISKQKPRVKPTKSLSKTAQKTTRKAVKQPTLAAFIVKQLDTGKATDIRVISLAGKTSMADTLIIASGTSGRHVASLAHHLAESLKDKGYTVAKDGSLHDGRWIALDAGDVLVHLFHPETRAEYNLEALWLNPADQK